jgi:hypothetical protein
LYAGENPAIHCRLLDMLAELHRRACRAEDRETIRSQAVSIRDRALQQIGDERHRRAVEERFAAIG